MGQAHLVIPMGLALLNPHALYSSRHGSPLRGAASLKGSGALPVRITLPTAGLPGQGREAPMGGIGWPTLQCPVEHFSNTLVIMGVGATRTLFIVKSSMPWSG